VSRVVPTTPTRNELSGLWRRVAVVVEAATVALVLGARVDLGWLAVVVIAASLALLAELLGGWRGL
jgi:hypothetical protein